jgi:hypothetical protein
MVKLCLFTTGCAFQYGPSRGGGALRDGAFFVAGIAQTKGLMVLPAAGRYTASGSVLAGGRHQVVQIAENRNCDSSSSASSKESDVTILSWVTTTRRAAVGQCQ